MIIFFVISLIIYKDNCSKELSQSDVFFSIPHICFDLKIGKLTSCINLGVQEN